VQQNKPLKVVFCFPGNSFSGTFLECWTNLFAYCLTNTIQPIISRKQSCNIYYVRNLCLGADVSRGKNQKPFNGQIEYDYIMWIDSDIVFTPQHFRKLLSHDKDIVSGIYMMDDGKHFATCREWDEEFFKKYGHFQFLTVEDINLTSCPLLREGEEQGKMKQKNERDTFIRKEELIEVSYTGMGFMLVRKEVFESMEYPWFSPLEKRMGDMVDFTMEDVAFCLKAKERGFGIFVDTSVRMGHEKRVVL
jgi:GT2 family glycosyltransferase